MRDDRSASLAMALLAFRRDRASFLPGELFAEPAWDLLLELFIADAQGRRIIARDVSERSNVPPRVMARWLVHLVRSGFVVGDGEGDLDDLLTLSAVALERMEKMMVRAQALEMPTN